MMWHIQYKKVRFVKTRWILSIILLLIVILLIVSIFNMKFDNKNELKEITKADYESLEIGQVVCGTISEGIIGVYDDEETRDYIVITENKKALIFRAPYSSGINAKMDQLYHHQIDSVQYRGKVNGIKEKSLTYLNLNAISLGLSASSTLKGNAHDFSTGTLLDIAEYDSTRQDKIYVAYVVCALFFLVVIFFLLRKILNNAIYAIAVQKGLIEPELKVKPEDIVDHSQLMYDTNENNGEFFYVSPEPDAPSSEAPAPPPKQDIDYYDSGVNEDGNFYVSGSDTSSAHRTRFDGIDHVDGDDHDHRTFNY